MGEEQRDRTTDKAGTADTARGGAPWGAGASGAAGEGARRRRGGPRGSGAGEAAPGTRRALTPRAPAAQVRAAAPERALTWSAEEA